MTSVPSTLAAVVKGKRPRTSNCYATGWIFAFGASSALSPSWLRRSVSLSRSLPGSVKAFNYHRQPDDQLVYFTALQAPLFFTTAILFRLHLDRIASPTPLCVDRSQRTTTQLQRRIAPCHRGHWREPNGNRSFIQQLTQSPSYWMVVASATLTILVVYP